MKQIIIYLIIFAVFFNIVFALDADKDGISDDLDKYPNDFDNDGMPDSWETKNGLRFDNTDNNLDSDGDGLSNYEEFRLRTDPNSKDSDGDDIDDFAEVTKQTDPLSGNRNIPLPIILAPIFIILAVILLFLFEKYHFDEKIIVWFNTKILKKKKSKRIINDDYISNRPVIRFQNITQQINQQKKQRENIDRIFGSKKQPSKKTALKSI
jgi:hypothetical protein